MLRPSLLVLCLITPWLQAEEMSADLAYSLGVQLGQELREEVPERQLQALLDGLRQAYLDEPLRLDSQNIEGLLTAYRAQQAAIPQKIEQAIVAQANFLASEKAKPGMRTLKNGILIQELRPGTGAKPEAKSRIQVRYIGLLADGRLFDESQTPQWYRLDSVIAGWQTALLQMPVGAHWRVVIPADQAYGKEGAGDLIPPYSPLVFELELLDTKD